MGIKRIVFMTTQLTLWKHSGELLKIAQWVGQLELKDFALRWPSGYLKFSLHFKDWTSNMSVVNVKRCKLF